ETLPVDDFAVTHGVELRVTLVHLKAALAATRLAKHEDYLIASRVDEPLRFHLPLVPHLSPSHGVLHDRLVSSRDLPVGEVCSIPFNIGVTERQAASRVVPEKRIPHSLHDLDVLSRHRLPVSLVPRRV